MLKKTLDPTKLSNALTLRAIQSRRPLSCVFELTYRCNFRCPMCYIRMTDEQAAPYGRLRTVDEWLDMARQVKEAGVLYLAFTGGECTTYPGFVQLYRKVSQMGFRVTLMSNAGAYTDEVRQAFAEYPPYGVNVTLYGGSNETYGNVTGDPHGLDRVFRNIRYLQDLRVPVGLNFTIIRDNVHDYPLVAKVAQELGLPFSICVDLTPHNRNAAFSSVLSCRLSAAEQACVSVRKPEEVDIALADAAVLEKQLTDFVSPVADPSVIVSEPSCIGSYTSSVIYWNGDMNTCVSLASASAFKPFEVGFEAAWQQMIANHDQRFPSSPVCSCCEMRQNCSRNCHGRRLEGTGSITEPDFIVCQSTWLRRIYAQQLHSDVELPSSDCFKPFD